MVEEKEEHPEYAQAYREVGLILIKVLPCYHLQGVFREFTHSPILIL